jgi:metal-sulfur cluster biosynthetic enzyme
LDKDTILGRALTALMDVRDPELPVNIVDLGLVYHLDITSKGIVMIEMTFTSPNCPASDEIKASIEKVLHGIPGINGVTINIVFSPMWNPKVHMSEDGKKYMKMLGYTF